MGEVGAFWAIGGARVRKMNGGTVSVWGAQPVSHPVPTQVGVKLDLRRVPVVGEVQTARSKQAGDVSIAGAWVGQIAGGGRLVDEIESPTLQDGLVLCVRSHKLYREPALCGDPLIDGKLPFR